jgi:hypothetical protein
MVCFIVYSTRTAQEKRSIQVAHAMKMSNREPSVGKDEPNFSNQKLMTIRVKPSEIQRSRQSLTSLRPQGIDSATLRTTGSV